MRSHLGIGDPQDLVCQLTKGIDGTQDEHTPCGHCLIDCVPKSFRSRHTDAQSTLLKKRIIVRLGHELRMKFDFLLKLLGDRRNRNCLRIMNNVQFRQCVVERRIGLFDVSVCLKDGFGVTPDVLATRHDCLPVILLVGHDLVDGRPSNVPNLASIHPLLKQFLCLVGLHPDFIHHGGIGFPGLVGPLGVGNPHVLRSIRKETGVDHFHKKVDLSLLALWEVMRHVTNLCLLAQRIHNHPVKNVYVLGHPCSLPVIADNVHSHYALLEVSSRKFVPRSAAQCPRTSMCHALPGIAVSRRARCH